jgi:AcrR family transcriptional regulator
MPRRTSGDEPAVGDVRVAPPPPRPMRADARRNYERLIAVAREAFVEKGPEVALDEIAKRAGVGAGTLYRHFPNRDALFEAVHRADIERLSARAYELRDSMPPADALAEWLREEVRYVHERRGLATTLKAAIGVDSEVFKLCKAIINDAAVALLEPAQRAGVVRRDIQARDLLLMAHGVGVATENAPEATDRLLTVMIDGLRPPDA